MNIRGFLTLIGVKGITILLDRYKWILGYMVKEIRVV